MISKEQRTRPQALYIWRLKHSRLRSEFHDRVANTIADESLSGWLVDVGCGPGLLAKKLLARAAGLRVVGIDIDMTMLREARAAGSGYLVRGSADSLPVRTGAIARLVSTTSLKDWANRSQGLLEVSRVIRPGGTASVYDFITVGPGSSPPHFVRRFGLISELLRRATGLMQPFSLDDAVALADGLRGRFVNVDVDVDREFGIVKIQIRKDLADRW